MCMHGGLSPDLQTMEQIRRVMRPTDVPDTGKKKKKKDAFRITGHFLQLIVRRFIV